MREGPQDGTSVKRQRAAPNLWHEGRGTAMGVCDRGQTPAFGQRGHKGGLTLGTDKLKQDRIFWVFDLGQRRPDEMKPLKQQTLGVKGDFFGIKAKVLGLLQGVGAVFLPHHLSLQIGMTQGQGSQGVQGGGKVHGDTFRTGRGWFHPIMA